MVNICYCCNRVQRWANSGNSRNRYRKYHKKKIFECFSGLANFKKKKYGETLANFKLKKTEQDTLLAAAEAHANLVFGQKKVIINLINIDLLERQVETDQNRL